MSEKLRVPRAEELKALDEFHSRIIAEAMAPTKDDGRVYIYRRVATRKADNVR